MRVATMACLGLALAAGLPGGPARADGSVKIGFINTLSGANAALGQDALDGFNLAIKLGGGRLGPAAVQLVVGDDQQQPEIGRQLVDKMGDLDKVDLFLGVAFSNVMQAIARPIDERHAILLSPNAALADQAGRRCSPGFFALRDQNDELHEAAGAYAAKQGYKKLYLIAPNYAAGKEALAGFKRYYKGDIAGEVYTPLNQLDFAAELAQLRAAKPDGVYFFYPGGLGISFLRQYEQAGLKGAIPLIGPGFSLDRTVLPAVGDAAVGAMSSAFWTDGMDNPANKQFVAAYKAEYRHTPSTYAAIGYDTARLLAAALSRTDGNATDRAALRTALATTPFDSVRGAFRFGPNQFPIQDYFLTEVVRRPDGEVDVDLRGTIFTGHADAYAESCKPRSF